MRSETAKRLLDAQHFCDEIQHFTSNWTRDEFLDDRGSQLIIWKLVEIVGKHCDGLSKATVTCHDVFRNYAMSSIRGTVLPMAMTR